MIQVPEVREIVVPSFRELLNAGQVDMDAEGQRYSFDP
jgi:hypothetical protein